MDEQNFGKSEEGYIKSPFAAPFNEKRRGAPCGAKRQQPCGKFEVRCHAGKRGAS